MCHNNNLNMIINKTIVNSLPVNVCPKCYGPMVYLQGDAWSPAGWQCNPCFDELLRRDIKEALIHVKTFMKDKYPDFTDNANY